MKYMYVWSVAPENLKAALKRFGEDSEPMDGLTQLGRWHSVGTDGGYRLIETDDPVALKRMTLYWQDVMETKIVPVVDDEETRKAI